MNKIKQHAVLTIVLSEFVHVFCCGLPTMFSVLSIAVGMGVMGSMPGVIVGMHDALHYYELPIIVSSGLILFAGWGLYLYSRKIDCLTDGACSHKPCSPKKDRTKLFMIVATLLFCMNLFVYLLIHE